MRADRRALWVLLASGLLGFRVGMVGFPDWQVAVETSQVLAAFNFYRWWTIPFDLVCMVLLIAVIVYSVVRDAGAAKAPVTP